MRQQRLIVLILGAVLLAAVVTGWYAYPRQRTVATLQYPPGVSLAASAPRAFHGHAAPRPVAALRLDLLGRREPAFAGYQRNIFQPLFESREAALARESARAAARMRRAQTAATPAPAAEPTPVQRELAAIRVQGFLEHNGRKLVFLARGTEVMVVKQGDVFAGRFVATAVSDHVLVATVRGSGEQILIPLVEGRQRHTAQAEVRPEPAD